MKEYFQHDYNARNSFQVQALMVECGDAAYGIFWAIIEVLHEKRNKMPMKDYIICAIAEQIKTTPEKVKKVIETSKNLGLFKETYGNLGSPRVKLNLTKRLDISKVRAKSGKLGAIAQQKVAKEKKGKESKEKEINTDVDAQAVETEKNNNDKFFRMMRNAAGEHLSDDELRREVGKFRNKYPNTHHNQAGALINTWVANIGKEKPKKMWN